jgi:hypothetical protein
MRRRARAIAISAPPSMPAWAPAIWFAAVLLTLAGAAFGQTITPAPNVVPPSPPVSAIPENPARPGDLARPNSGVIVPPSNMSDMPVIQPPAGGTMPVIPPPATSGNQRVVPK